jgi:hypothetical protein
MTRISSHLPALGALVIAVVVAAVAYSVYESGQPTQHNGASSARGAGLAAAGLTNDQTADPKPAQDSKRPRRRADGGGRAAASANGADLAPVSGGAPGPAAPVLRPVTFEPPVSAPHSQPKPDGGNRADRELRRIIDGPGARPKPGPRSPKPGPRSPKPGPRSPKPVAPAPIPKQQPNGDGTSSPAPAQPAQPGATPTDPEAGLDDLPVGGLDQTDIGEPIDEPATTPPTTPAPAPADPEAGLDDTAGGGLDQTDLGQPVDETGTG